VRRHRLLFAVTAPLVVALAGALAGPVSANPVSPVAFAVGAYYDGTNDQMLIEQWNGSKWASQSHPTVAGAQVSGLNAVRVTSTSNAWAVGEYYGSDLIYRNLIIRWNGSSWSIQTAPNKGTGSNQLNAISATSSSSAWAGGLYYDSSNVVHALMEHWNGSAWTIQTLPTISSWSQIRAVSAISDTNVWAFGSSGGSHDKSLALHWNGTKWSVKSLPAQGTSDNDLWDGGASSGQDIWAVGDYFNGTNSRTLALHKTSSGWHVVPTPNLGTSDEELRAVAPISSTNAWALGKYYGTTWRIHLLHWNGSSWATKSPAAIAGAYGRNLFAMSANNVWILGQNSTVDNLVVHYDGSKWSMQPADVVGTNDILFDLSAVP